MLLQGWPDGWRWLLVLGADKGFHWRASQKLGVQGPGEVGQGARSWHKEFLSIPRRPIRPIPPFSLKAPRAHLELVRLPRDGRPLNVHPLRHRFCGLLARWRGWSAVLRRWRGGLLVMRLAGQLCCQSAQGLHGVNRPSK